MLVHHPKLGERSSLERSPGSAESISEFWQGTAAGLDGLLKWPARQAPCPQGRLAGLTVEEELGAPDDG